MGLYNKKFVLGFGNFALDTLAQIDIRALIKFDFKSDKNKTNTGSWVFSNYILIFWDW